MDVSAPVELVWHVAAKEAARAGFEFIEPDHFLVAVLKFCELPVSELTDDPSLASLAEQLTTEQQELLRVFHGIRLDTTATRRSLRRRLGSGDHRYDGATMHRSPASRQLFERAEGLASEAGKEVLQAPYLLSALLGRPTDNIRGELGDRLQTWLGESTVKPPKQYGRSLCAATDIAGRQRDEVAVNEIANVLCTPRQNNVLIVTDEAARVANLLGDLLWYVETASSSGDLTPENASLLVLKQYSFVDLHAIAAQTDSFPEIEVAVMSFVADKRRRPTVLLLPPWDKRLTNIVDDPRWEVLLRSVLNHPQLHLVFRVAVSDLETLTQHHEDWTTLAYALRTPKEA